MNIRQTIYKLWNGGFFYIIGAGTLNKIISFCGGILVVRIFTKEEFGILSYVQNILALFLLFNGLGSTSALLQFGSASKTLSELDSYIQFALKRGLCFNCALILIIIGYAYWGPVKIPEAVPYLLAFSCLPLLILFYDITILYLRVTFQNKLYAYFNVLNSFLLTLLMFALGYFYGIKGVVIANYISYSFLILLLVYCLRDKLIGWLRSHVLNKCQKKQFNKYGLICAFNDSISQLLFIIDIFLIGIVIGDTKIIASYKVASTIPFALNFIPTAIMVFVYPYFARNCLDPVWVRENYLKLLKYCAGFDILLMVILVIFAPFIITLIFGPQYKDSIPCFIILMVGYFLGATFRTTTGNLLAAIGRVDINFYFTIVMGILSIGLNLLLIKYFGSIGAAWSNLIVISLAALCSTSVFLVILNKRIKQTVNG